MAAKKKKAAARKRKAPAAKKKAGWARRVGLTLEDVEERVRAVELRMDVAEGRLNGHDALIEKAEQVRDALGAALEAISTGGTSLLMGVLKNALGRG